MSSDQHLLLIPGLVCDAAVWRHQVAHLADVAEISVPPVVEGESMAAMARAVLDVAPAKFALAGFSMGGYIALEVFRQAPERVTRLALLDTSARSDSPEKATWRQAAIARCERGEFTSVIEGMMPILMHPDQQSGPLPQFVRDMVGRVGVEAFVRRHRAIGMRQDSRDLLRAAKQPVRSICGRQDGMSTIAEHDEIAELAPHGRFSIIEQCGHMTILERPQAATKRVARECQPSSDQTGEGFLFGVAHLMRSGDLIPDCQPVQTQNWLNRRHAMTATIVRLLPADERALLQCYVEGTSEPDNAAAIYDALEVPAEATPPRLSIAVAQILLHHVQGTLPQWASVSSDTVSLNRKAHKRHKDARLAFNPQLICTINWADSGPGFSWPESYHVTCLPGFDKFVITASRDGPDAWGCDDHAIGVADGSLSPVDAAKEVVAEFWRMQVNAWDQGRWAYLFAQGLIDTKTADAWADEVWSQPEEEDEAEEEEDA